MFALHYALPISLQAGAQDDVQRIGDLVGLDADEAALHPGVDPPQVGRVPCRAVAAERSLRLRRQEAEEGRRRSEEHTSELQSLMRNSYAVYLLKQKNISYAV